MLLHDAQAKRAGPHYPSFGACRGVGEPQDGQDGVVGGSCKGQRWDSEIASAQAMGHRSGVVPSGSEERGCSLEGEPAELDTGMPQLGALLLVPCAVIGAGCAPWRIGQAPSDLSEDPTPGTHLLSQPALRGTDGGRCGVIGHEGTVALDLRHGCEIAHRGVVTGQVSRWWVVRKTCCTKQPSSPVCWFPAASIQAILQPAQEVDVSKHLVKYVIVGLLVGAAVIGAVVAWLGGRFFGWAFIPAWPIAAGVLFVTRIPGIFIEAARDHAVDERIKELEARDALPARTVEMPNGVLVTFYNDEGHVTWSIDGLEGEPHFLFHSFAQDALTRQQLDAGEEPWFPDAAERLKKRQSGTT